MHLPTRYWKHIMKHAHGYVYITNERTNDEMIKQTKPHQHHTARPKLKKSLFFLGRLRTHKNYVLLGWMYFIHTHTQTHAYCHTSWLCIFVFIHTWAKKKKKSNEPIANQWLVTIPYSHKSRISWCACHICVFVHVSACMVRELIRYVSITYFQSK